MEKVRIGRDRDGRQKSFAFITFCHDVSVPYAIQLFRGTALYNKTLILQCRGRMPLLPAPIRCYGAEPINFGFQPQVTDQFSDMTKQLSGPDIMAVNALRQNQDHLDKLVVASLRGNCSYRHHPYRGKEMLHSRDDYRSRELHHKNNRNQSSNWRDRRNHGSGRHYRD